MKEYLIGIDGGGTNSRLLACDLEGKVIGRSDGSSTNIESNSLQTVGQNLQKLLTDFFETHNQPAEKCLAIGFGTAGVDTEESLKTVQKIVDNLHLPCPIYVFNDAEIALAAQTRGKPGILLISGTGSIGYGLNDQGEEKRVGGYGYLVGDEGSGYWLGNKAIKAALRSFDGTQNKTMLLPMLLKTLKIHHAEELVDFVYQANKNEIAALSFLVEEARAAGDSTAMHIMEKAAKHLSNMAIALAEKLSMEEEQAPLVMAGGVLLNTPWLMERTYALVKKHCPNMMLTPLEKEAVIGGIYIAAKMQHITLPNIG